MFSVLELGVQTEWIVGYHDIITTSVGYGADLDNVHICQNIQTILIFSNSKSLKVNSAILILIIPSPNF